MRYKVRTGAFLLPAAVLWAVVAVGCGGPAVREEQSSAPASPASDVVFRDVTAAVGIQFEHNNGRSGKKWLPETLGSGCAFFDYNNDDWPDILLINSKPWTPAAGQKVTSKLYRNNRDGTFTDVTAEAGLAIEMYGMGVAAGDYDNDGYLDLYITALDGDHLFHNEGNGTFRDVTSQSGITNAKFGTSVAWLDYDRDGLLDVFVENYVDWTPEKDLWCSLDGETKSYCTPESYNGVSSVLYRNMGKGHFADVTRQAGLYDPTSKALGIAVFDYDSDGYPDIFQANDTQPNKLYRNKGNGTFEDTGVSAGVAFAEDGRARGAMGVDAADYDRSGRPHLVIGNFSNEMITLYHNEGTGLFVDEAPASAVGRESLLSLTFAMFFFDYDLDGRLDIFGANGHLDEEINNVQPNVQYAQPPLLFRNAGNGKFVRIRSAGKPGAGGGETSDLFKPLVARGAAYGDYDRDGDLDLLISTNNGAAHLFRNDGGNANSYLRLKLVGKQSNRAGIGAVARIKSASGEQWLAVHSGSSYLSQSELPLTFGLGKDAIVDRVEIVWPSGEQQTIEQVEPNKMITIEEKPSPGASD
jgi:enediyne biosynthesis protein E4